MSHPTPSGESHRRSAGLAGTPAVRHGTHWWLVGSSGAIHASDPNFTGELDCLAADLAAADQAVAALATERKTARKARP
ncbi:hypothetical protein OHA73_35630 [Streptomyces sp. NBC_00483]